MLQAVAGGVAGAVAGSFLATAFLRWPEGRSISRGRSGCDSCGSALQVFELVPLVSYLILRGRCRTCKGKIAVAHFAIEAVCAAIGSLAQFAAPGLPGLAWALLMWILLVSALLDLGFFWLPDLLTLPLAVFGLGLGGVTSSATLTQRTVGLTVGFGSLWLIARVYRAARGREGLGAGDAKLLGAIGAWLGWRPLPLVVLVACGFGLFAVLIMRGAGRTTDRDTRLPLGTLLCAATLPGWILSSRLFELQ